MRGIVIFLVSLTFFLPTLALASEVYHYKLKNGLQLFVKRDTRAPVVVSEVWYKVGSSDEPDGLTGISHVLEHMMFRGTKKYGPGELTKIIAANGGIENAFTYYDYTGYFQILSADKLPISFKLEADRMHNLLLQQQQFAKEIQIVMEERRMRVNDNPQALTAIRFAAAAFVSNPYHHPVIGWMNDLQNMTVANVRKWYDTWYAPNNALVVVVGDVKPDKVYQLAKQYFGPLKSRPVPKIKPRKEVPSLGERQVVVRVPAKLPWLIMGYNVPVLKTDKQTWQPYALDVLVGILDGSSGRLPRELVRGQQIAASVSAGYQPFFRYSTLLTMSGIPAQGHTLDQLETAFLQQIKQLQQQPVSAAELARVKAQVIAGNIFKKDSLVKQANEIGSLEAVGLSWRLGDAFVKNINAVTAKQVQQVARQYLVTHRLTVAKLEPLPLKQLKPKQPKALGGRHVR